MKKSIEIEFNNSPIITIKNKSNGKEVKVSDYSLLKGMEGFFILKLRSVM